jgi:hypothetical protein
MSTRTVFADPVELRLVHDVSVKAMLRFADPNGSRAIVIVQMGLERIQIISKLKRQYSRWINYRSDLSATLADRGVGVVVRPGRVLGIAPTAADQDDIQRYWRLGEAHHIAK